MFALLILVAIAAAAFGFFLIYDETGSWVWAIVAALAAVPLAMLFVVLIGAAILPRIGA